MMVIVLFSLGAVVAGENITEEVSVSNDVAVPTVGQTSVDDSGDGEDVLNADEPSTLKAVSKFDLKVKIDVNTSYDGKAYNTEGLEVPWTITVKSLSGNARNVMVRETLSSNLQYISHNLTKGTYDSSRGIWTVGELEDSQSVSLTIITKLLSNGTFTNTVKVEPTTLDLDKSNNEATLSIETGEEDSGSHTTETTDDKNKYNADDHYGSEGGSGVVERQNVGGDSSKTRGGDSKSPNDKKPGYTTSTADSKKRHKSGLTRSTSSFVRSISSPVRAFAEILNPDLSSGNDSSDANASSSTPSKGFEAVPPQNYSTIPLSVFALFLLALLGIVAGDKIRS